MNYIIKTTGNIIGNPLRDLEGREFETRPEACEAIFHALEPVIQADGCDMVDQEGFYSEDDDHWLDRYATACNDFIVREGYATNDGMTATVVAI